MDAEAKVFASEAKVFTYDASRTGPDATGTVPEAAGNVPEDGGTVADKKIYTTGPMRMPALVNFPSNSPCPPRRSSAGFEWRLDLRALSLDDFCEFFGRKRMRLTKTCNPTDRGWSYGKQGEIAQLKNRLGGGKPL